MKSLFSLYSILIMNVINLKAIKNNTNQFFGFKQYKLKTISILKVITRNQIFMILHICFYMDLNGSKIYLGFMKQNSQKKLHFA